MQFEGDVDVGGIVGPIFSVVKWASDWIVPDFQIIYIISLKWLIYLYLTIR